MCCSAVPALCLLIYPQSPYQMNYSNPFASPGNRRSTGHLGTAGERSSDKANATLTPDCRNMRTPGSYNNYDAAVKANKEKQGLLGKGYFYQAFLPPHRHNLLLFFFLHD